MLISRSRPVRQPVNGFIRALILLQNALTQYPRGRVLLGVGLSQVVRGREREATQRGWLMIAAGIVIAGNVVIWTV